MGVPSVYFDDKTMRFLVVLLALVAAILRQDASISSADCEKKCDAVFAMLDTNDEAATDDHCKYACQCAVDHNCGGPQGSMMPPSGAPQDPNHPNTPPMDPNDPNRPMDHHNQQPVQP